MLLRAGASFGMEILAMQKECIQHAACASRFYGSLTPGVASLPP